MDPQTDLPDLVEDLEVNIDELSDILSPLLTTPLSTTASSLPLLDKAKLYVLAAYSIESLLYSSIQASGLNAKEHEIFKELGRLKGYFGKIKGVEERPMAPSAPKSKLDVGAAARFIKHGLAGNQQYDLERAERLAKEKARAYLKAQQMNKKFDDNGAEIAKDLTPKKRDAEEMHVEEPQANYNDGEEVLEGLEEPEAEAPVLAEQPAPKRQRLSVAANPMDDSTPSQSQSEDKEGKKKRQKRSKKKTNSADASDAEMEEVAEPVTAQDVAEVAPEPKTSKKTRSSSKKTSQSTSLSVSEADAPGPTNDPDSQTSEPKKKKHRAGRRTRSSATTAADSNEDAAHDDEEQGEEAQETIFPARTPKTRSETSTALLDGSLPEKQKEKRGRGRPPKAKK